MHNAQICCVTGIMLAVEELPTKLTVIDCSGVVSNNSLDRLLLDSGMG